MVVALANYRVRTASPMAITTVAVKRAQTTAMAASFRLCPKSQSSGVTASLLWTWRLA